MTSLKVSSTNSAASKYANSTAILLLRSVLSQKEICDFNSYDVDDFRIENLHFPVLLPERKIFEIYLRSLHRLAIALEHLSASILAQKIQTTKI